MASDMIDGMRPWLLVFALAACGNHNGDTGTAPKQAAASQCKRAAEQMIDLMSARTDATPDNIKKMTDMITERCDQDHWSAEAQSCVTSAKVKDDLSKCESLFTKAQADALIQSVERKRDEGAAAGGGAPTTGAPAPSAVAPGAPPPPPKDTTRSPTKKPPTKKSDPCEGGQ
jgi:hypothetical protein